MLPRVVLHSGVSADSRIDWFTPHVGLYYSLIPHWAEHATLAGVDTLLKAQHDIPDELPADMNPPTVADDDPRPILVVPDSRGRLRSWHYWRSQPYWKNCVALVSSSTPKDYLKYLAKRQINIVVAGDDHVDYRLALEKLNSDYGVKIVRVDSGGTLNGVLLRAGLVDEVSVLIHPVLVGGTSAQSFYRAPDLESAGGVIPLRLTHMQKLAHDVLWVVYEVSK